MPDSFKDAECKCLRGITVEYPMIYCYQVHASSDSQCLTSACRPHKSYTPLSIPPLRRHPMPAMLSIRFYQRCSKTQISIDSSYNICTLMNVELASNLKLVHSSHKLPPFLPLPQRHAAPALVSTSSSNSTAMYVFPRTLSAANQQQSGYS